MKKKKTKLYIIVPHENGNVTLFSADKIEELVPFLPSMEAIKNKCRTSNGKMEKRLFLQAATAYT